ncbi:MAG: hypothetical protein K9L17_02535 [Clostridiales bacterium]|nr:hypothetical protein [Clostridiales bacterium]MCF8021556.1 hypothetical protein [Clostridiales bacterium]
MSTTGTNYDNENNIMENMLEKLLEYRDKEDFKDRDLQVMLSLLNLLGIVNMLNLRQKVGSKDQAESSQGQLPFNPALLLNLLGGNQQGAGQGLDISKIMGLVNSFMGGGPASTGASQSHDNSSEKEQQGGSAAGKMKVEKNTYKSQNNSDKKNFNKAAGSTNFKKNEGKKNEGKKQTKEILYWDFENKKKA